MIRKRFDSALSTSGVQPVSNAPSAAYRKHFDVEPPRIDAMAFRPGWRVHPRLQGLADSGDINREQLEAAMSWGRWSELTGGPVTSAWRLRVDGGSPTAGRMVGAHQLDAAKRLRGCAAALGPEWCALLHAIIVEDQSWRRLADRLGVACVTAKKRTVEAIVALGRQLAF